MLNPLRNGDSRIPNDHSGYYKEGGTETALNKMARVLTRENALREIPRTQASNYEESA